MVKQKNLRGLTKKLNKLMRMQRLGKMLLESI